MKAMLLATLLVILSPLLSHGFTFYGLEFGKPRPCQGAEQEHKGYVSCPIELADFKKFDPAETRLIKIDNLAEGIEIQFAGRDKYAVMLQRDLDAKYGKGKQSALSGATYRRFAWHREGHLMQLLLTLCDKPLGENVAPQAARKFQFCLDRLTVQSPKLTGLIKKDFVQPPLQK